MGARKRRSTETALQLLTEQVHEIWNLPGAKRVATLLSMDISGAFPNVSHSRLLHNLRKRKIPLAYTSWVESFLKDRKTTIKLFEGESHEFTAETGIPQGSPTSPILFLFFIADLLDLTNNTALRLSASGFVDDINLLTYSESTEKNCSTLERIHKDCAKWSDTHGVRFAPEKYELLHFTRSPKRFNMAATPRIEGLQPQTKGSIRVLGIQIDTKLKWNPHIAKIHDRYASQSLALGRITASTWGASFERARLVYSAVVTPVITYGAGIWYSPQGTETARKSTGKQLETLQNQGLRRILGAYKAVSSAVLEKEADIPPIEATLSKVVANSLKRRHQTKGGQVVTKACEAIRNHNPAGTRAQRKRKKVTPYEAKTKWLRKSIPEDTWNREILQRPTTSNDMPKPTTWKEAVAKITGTCWDKKWTAYLSAIPADRVKSPSQLVTDWKRSQLHKGLSKPMSSLITQIRTEKIGLNAFLADRRVPGYTATCPCGWPRQTAKHILMNCTDYEERRPSLFRAAGTRDYKEMTATTRGVKAAAQWLYGTGLLQQFSLGLGETS
jgi:hypothetical protein